MMQQKISNAPSRDKKATSEQIGAVFKTEGEKCPLKT